ncbi:MAG: hypothetical protein ACP5RM_00490 [Candidatus Micrarchaeia archaeon]
MAGMYAISIALLSLMISISGIILGLGIALGNKRLKEFGESELFEAFINGAILGVIIVMFQQGGLVNTLINEISSQFALSATCGQQMSSNIAICFASSYLAGISPVQINGVSYPSLLTLSSGMLLTISALYVAVSLVSSVKFSFIISISFATLFAPFITQFGRLISLLTTSIIGIEAQAMLLKFVSIAIVPIMLPAGIILRIVPITRKLGGAFIAIVIGLFCVFPLSYVFEAGLVSNYSQYANSTAMESLSSAANSAAKNVTVVYTSFNSTQNQTGMLGVLSGFAYSISSELMGFIRYLSNFVALLIIEVFFIPVFSMLITVISIREFARLLGSDMNFGGRYLGYI